MKLFHDEDKCIITVVVVVVVAASHILPLLFPVFDVLSHPLAGLSTPITLPRQKGPMVSHVEEVSLDKRRTLGSMRASFVRVWGLVANFALFSMGRFELASVRRMPRASQEQTQSRRGKVLTPCSRNLSTPDDRFDGAANL